MFDCGIVVVVVVFFFLLFLFKSGGAKRSDTRREIVHAESRRSTAIIIGPNGRRQRCPSAVFVVYRSPRSAILFLRRPFISAVQLFKTVNSDRVYRRRRPGYYTTVMLFFAITHTIYNGEMPLWSSRSFGLTSYNIVVVGIPI